MSSSASSSGSSSSTHGNPRPTLGRRGSASGSSVPLVPHSASPSTTSFAFAPSSYQHTHIRADSTAALSWVAPEDFDPTTLLDAPRPRSPGSSGQASGHLPRMRSLSFGAASSLLSNGTPANERPGSRADNPFRDGSRPPSAFGLNPRASSALALNAVADNRTSLSINYAPSKFSDALAVGGAGPRRRRPRKDLTGRGVGSRLNPNSGGLKREPTLARGGGVDAFRRGETRVAADRDDLDPAPPARSKFFDFDRADKRARWTRFKWVLLAFNAVYTVFALAALVTTILIWLDIIPKSSVIRVANRPELVFSTLAAAVATFTAVFGWAGVMLNNRSILAFYCLFLWFSFAFLVTPGYITYKIYALNLPAKLNQAWSQDYSTNDRREIQNALGCCGYFSPYVEASVSARCYSRSVLPGCKAPYLAFQHGLLHRWFTAVFSLAGFHILLIAASLLCANHVTYRFGKGMMPERYRLNEEAVEQIMRNYKEQIAEEYGEEVAERFVESQRQSRAGSVVDLLSHSNSTSPMGGTPLPSPGLLGTGHGQFPSSGIERAHSPLAQQVDAEEDLTEMREMKMNMSTLALVDRGESGAGTKYGTIEGTRPDTAI